MSIARGRQATKTSATRKTVAKMTLATKAAAKKTAAAKSVAARKTPAAKTVAAKSRAIRGAPVAAKRTGARQAVAAKKTAAKKTAVRVAGSVQREQRALRQAPAIGRGRRPAFWPERTRFLITALGTNIDLARILGVSASQPSRWKSGDEQPGPETARIVIDLDHILARAVLQWEPDVALTWLVSPNGHLDGATPLNVLRTRGTSEVLDALDAAAAGAFA